MRKITGSLILVGLGLAITLGAQGRSTTQNSAKESGKTPGNASIGPAGRWLMAENQVILQVLDVAKAEADRIRRGFFVDKNLVRDILDFSRHFTEQCHYAKEQGYYFPAVQVYLGPPAFDLVEQLEAEHTYGRSVLAEIDYLLSGYDSFTSDVGKLIAERLTAYATVLRRHIRLENEQLYSKATAALPPAEQRALVIGFQRVEDELGPDFCQRYRRLAADLSNKMLLPP